MIDRIDIHIEVPGVPFTELRSVKDGTGSSAMREQVQRARQRQRQRYGDQSTVTNSRISGKSLREHCQLDKLGEQALLQAMNELGLSARAHDKVLRIARTIADIENSDNITTEQVMEAIHYRRLDRRL